MTKKIQPIKPVKINTPGLKGYEEIYFFYGIRAKDAYGQYLNKKKLRSKESLTLLDSIQVYYLGVQHGTKKATGKDFTLNFDQFIDAIDDGIILEEALAEAFKVFQPGEKNEDAKK